MTQDERFEVKWTQAAVADLIAIVTYAAQQSESGAATLIDLLEARASGLGTMPRRGRVVPELARFGIGTFLEVLERPYRLVYRIDGPVVTVLAVLDRRRHLEDLLLERLTR